MDNTKTQWQCPACHKEGCVFHGAKTPVIDIIDKIVKQHTAKSILCTVPFLQLQVKYFGA